MCNLPFSGLHWPHAWGKHFNTPVPLTAVPLSSIFQRLQEKWQGLMEKLLPRACIPSARDVAPLLVEERRKDDSFTIFKSDSVAQQSSDTAKERATDKVSETPQSTTERGTTVASASTTPSIPAAGERLFVFRDPPESNNYVDAPKRKKKMNFLNLKKGSVAPTNQPWNYQNFLFLWKWYCPIITLLLLCGQWFSAFLNVLAFWLFFFFFK